MKTYFQDKEYLCRCMKCGGGIERMDKSFLVMLNTAREITGFPWTLTSAYRCPAHNKAIGSTSDNHPAGCAADVRCLASYTRYKIITAALKAGFTRIGIHKSFVHLDTNPGQVQEVIWFY